MSEVESGQQTNQTNISEASAAGGTGTDGHVVKAGGDSATSFDEFEALESYSHRKAEVKAKEELKEEKIKKEVKKEVEKPSKKQAKGKKEEDSEEAEKPETEEVRAESDTEADASEEMSVKELEFKVGDKSVKLREDAQIAVKVDGKEQMVTLSDLRNSWSGHEAVKKRFDEYNQAKQSFTLEKNNFVKERQQLDDRINEIHTLASADPEAAILRAVELIGGDSEKFLQELRENYQREQDELAQMSEAERAEYLGNKKAEVHKKRFETLQKQIQAKEKQTALNLQIEALQKKYEVDGETFDKYAEELIDLKNRGQIKSELTPEFVMETILTDRRYDMVEGILGEIDPDLSKNSAIVDELVKIGTTNPEFTNDDMRAIIFDAYGDQAKAQIVNKKLKANKQAKPSVSRSPQSEEIFNFDQL